MHDHFHVLTSIEKPHTLTSTYCCVQFSRRLVLDPPTPAPTPTPAAPGDQAAGNAAPRAAGAPAPAPAPGQAVGAAPGFGHFGNNAQPGPVHPPHQGMGYPLFAPQGHYPLAGWHPQAVGGAFPGAIPPEAGQTAATAAGTVTAAGTGAGAGTPGATPMTQPGFIPSYTIPNVAHPIPGFIPLFPVGYAATPTSGLQAQGGSEAAGTPTPFHGRATADQIPLTSLDALSEDQLKYLEENTRRGLQERLRVLQAVESQIAESVSVLNRVLGALPPAGTPFRSETADPPSPTMPLTSNSSSTPSAGPNGTARNWVFGSVVGPALNTSSPVGLQTLTRGLSNGTVNGATNGSVNGAVNGNSNADVSVPLATEAKTTVAASLPEEVSPPPPTSTSPSPIPSSVAIAALNGSHEPEGETSGSTTTTTTATTAAADNSKGKGRKSDADLEQDLVAESQQVYREQETADGEDLANDGDEDSEFSPQERVRRRWAQSG